MDEAKRKGIIQQYDNAMKIIASLPINDDEKIIQAAYQSILRILLVTQRSDVPFSQVTDAAFDQRLRTMQGVLKALEDFSKSAATRPLSTALQGQVNLVDDFTRRLINVKNNRLLLTNNIDTLRKEVESLEDDQQQKNKTVKGLTERHAELNQLVTELQEQTNLLNNGLNEATVISNELQANLPIRRYELTDLKEKNEKLNNEIKSIQEEIDKQPEENRRLQQQYDKLKQTLEDTQNALVRCSESKQQELQAEIDALTPEREQLETRYKELNSLLDTARQLKTDAQTKVDEELTALWPQLTDIMSTLSGKMGNLESELSKTRQRAEAFYDTVRECNINLERLQQWYKAQKTPLDALCERVEGANDYTDKYLRQTWNVNQSQQIKNRMSEIERILTELSDMLREAVGAVERDEAFVRRCADTNEADARSSAEGIK